MLTVSKKSGALFCSTLFLTISAIATLPAGADVLTSESFKVSSSAGQMGANATTTDMIIQNNPSWSGGAVGVQGNASTKVGGGSPPAANVTFKFNVGPTVDTLNSTYGAGNWTISNVQLSLQYTLYANNTRFGGGAGTFDIYWVGNDTWTQGTNDPVYATDQTTLNTWAGSSSDLASINFPWTSTPADPTNPSQWQTSQSIPPVSYDLSATAGLVNDVTSATGAADPNVSLYLMATDNTLGMCIFTGGSPNLPTLSFDVISVPEPAAATMLALGSIWITSRRRR